jgi:hypothetical protein
MLLPPDEPNTDPAKQETQITPTGVSVLTLVHENMTLNFRLDRTPTLGLPSLWRLAKHVVYERGPLIVSRYKAPTT